VHVASKHERPGKPAKEWLLIEWPEGEDEPTKYWLLTLPRNISFRDLVDAAKLRWRVERDYEELKQEVGLGHFEGRGWRGFHHHATLCIAAYGFLISGARDGRQLNGRSFRQRDSNPVTTVRVSPKYRNS
jgi:SRSO17 transposase